MPLSSKSVDDFLLDNRTFSVFLYGSPGVGKTLLAASAQKAEGLANITFVDADPGLITIAGFDEKIQKTSFNSVKELLDLPKYLKSQMPDVKTVIFDTVTAIASRRMGEIQDGAGRVDKPEWQDYGVVTRNLDKVVTNLRSAGYSVIMTSGVKDENNKEGTLVNRRPDLSPELKRRMEHTTDHIWYVFLAPDGSYNILYQPMTTGSGGVVDAKTRYFAFNEKLKTLQKGAGVIKIGQVGEDPKKYPNLATFYDLFIQALEQNKEKV